MAKFLACLRSFLPAFVLKALDAGGLNVTRSHSFVILLLMVELDATQQLIVLCFCLIALGTSRAFLFSVSQLHFQLSMIIPSLRI